MESFILLSAKEDRHQDLFDFCQKNIPGNWVWIKQKDDFTLEFLESLKPSKIFVPHWSYIIPESITSSFDVVIFHMTDLPYGRGGTPLQNLIVRGHDSTMLSALKADSGIDTGPIYLKKELSLEGTAEEIFSRLGEVSKTMIQFIAQNNPVPIEQQGEPVVFQRRGQKDCVIPPNSALKKIYDYIRMLDAPDYPKAYIEFGDYKLEFEKASIKEEELKAQVTFRRKK